MHQIPTISNKIISEIALGAEARIYESNYLNYPVICKERLPKPYRVKAIDEKLRKERSIQETRLLETARKIGINVPMVLDLDKSSWTIKMEKIEGKPLKKLIDAPNIEDYFTDLGKILALLHGNNIIHGDLTTSNIFVDQNEKIWLIDFGLGFISPQLEDQAVDILVLKHTLESSHPTIHEEMFSILQRNYIENYDEGEMVIRRLTKVEGRVRYRSH